MLMLPRPYPPKTQWHFDRVLRAANSIGWQPFFFSMARDMSGGMLWLNSRGRPFNATAWKRAGVGVAQTLML
jgi:hypothetical protein